MSKTRLSWIEPQSFCAEAAERRRASLLWWHRPFLMLVIFVLLLANWQIGRLNPKNHPPSLMVVIPMALALGAFVVYAVPWLNARLTSRIFVTDKHFVRSQGQKRRVLLAAVRSFAWQEGPGHHTLTLTLNRGQELRFGVPREIVREVTALLATTGAGSASAGQ